MIAGTHDEQFATGKNRHFFERPLDQRANTAEKDFETKPEGGGVWDTGEKRWINDPGSMADGYKSEGGWNARQYRPNSKELVGKDDLVEDIKQGVIKKTISKQEALSRLAAVDRNVFHNYLGMQRLEHRSISDSLRGFIKGQKDYEVKAQEAPAPAPAQAPATKADGPGEPPPVVTRSEEAPAPAPATKAPEPETQAAGWVDDGKPISVNDPDAHTKLSARIKDSNARLERMKLVNSVMRKHAGKSIRHDYGNGYTPTWKEGKSAQTAAAALRGVGLTDAEVARALRPGAFGDMGHAPYEMTNLNANIKRMQTRIAEVEQHRRNTAQAAPEQSYSTRDDAQDQNAGPVQKPVSGVTVTEHPEEGRMRVKFPGRPDNRQIQLLKSHGFKWAPSQGAWSRILTDNARYSARMLMSALGLAKDAQESFRPKPQQTITRLVDWLTQE